MEGGSFLPNPPPPSSRSTCAKLSTPTLLLLAVYRRCVIFPKTDSLDGADFTHHSSLLKTCVFSLCAPSRHHRADSVGGGGVGRQPGEHLRHVGAAEPALPADSAHGAHGPEGRHLETAGLGGLRTQQGARETRTSCCCCCLCTQTPVFFILTDFLRMGKVLSSTAAQMRNYISEV